MNKYAKKCRDLAAQDVAAKPELGPGQAEAEKRADEALDARGNPQVVLDSLRWLAGSGFRSLYDFAADKVAKIILRPASESVALAQAREGIGAGFFDEAEDLRTPQKDYRIDGPEVAAAFGQMLRQYAPACVVAVRPRTPYFEEGAWVPGPRQPQDVGPAIPRPGCVPVKITGLLPGGGWVWVRRRPGGGIQAIRFPFHRATIESVKEVPGAAFSHATREWSMKDGSDATILFLMVKQVLPLEDLSKVPE